MDESATMTSRNESRVGADQHKFRVAYVNVHNSDYPRNRLIREELARKGGYSVSISQKLESRYFASKTLVNYLRIFGTTKNSDVIVLSEFSLRYAPFTWLLSRFGGAVHVVDGFVRLYESRVEDASEASPRSWKAFAYRAIDRLSVICSDMYLVDTKMRAARIAAGSRGSNTVVSLPVGAPSWARSISPATKSAPVKFLYYGNYIHLHGVDVIVKAFSHIRDDCEATLTLVGEGSLRREIEILVQDLGLGDRCVFVDPVPESSLRDIIAAHDVVLGIFGTSSKAGSVIANKVWQGLACGRLVITRESPALGEISPIIGSQLMTTPEGDDVHLAGIMRTIIQQDLYTSDFSKTSEKLQDYVQAEFRPFLEELTERVKAHRQAPRRRR
ncbi:glycosyltransferase [Pseudarthrobacter sp. NPDC057230]|uniref:glycosyltransferase n=1 Tax=Pseudarthrobacter sp. NPDC057230 TaxID=3346057 RepID=UPI003627D8AE